MSIFSGLQSYGTKWAVKEEREFTKDEIKEVRRASVVNSEYGKSVCFVMKAGGTKYIPLSNESDLAVGDDIELDSLKAIVLERDGDADILRVDGDAA